MIWSKSIVFISIKNLFIKNGTRERYLCFGGDITLFLLHPKFEISCFDLVFLYNEMTIHNLV